MRYNVFITLADGNEIHAVTEAKTQQEAIEKVLTLQEVAEFKKGSPVARIEAMPLTAHEAPSEFLLQQSAEPGWWVLTDTVNMAVLKFKQGAFNETQKITYLNDVPADSGIALKLATINRKMADWLLANHKDLL